MIMLSIGTKQTFVHPERIEYRLPDADDGAIIRHNDIGPAVTTQYGYTAYYVNGKRHRIGGPAIELDGFQAYYQDGLPHRSNGPAKIFSDGTKQWFFFGEKLSEADFNKKVNPK